MERFNFSHPYLERLGRQARAQSARRMRRWVAGAVAFALLLGLAWALGGCAQ